MLSAGPSFIILGVVVAWATADNSMVLLLNSSMSVNVTVTPFPSNANGTFTTSNGNRSSTTAQGNGTSVSTTVQPKSTFTPSHPPATTTSNGGNRGRAKTKAPKVTAQPVSELDDATGIIILVVIIIIALGFGLACYFARKRGRRYSVDFNSRGDDANIPLSTVEPELTADAVTQNGLKTFENADFSNKEADVEPTVELEAEAEGAAADPSAESAAPDTAKDEPKAGVVERTPSVPAEMSVDEKTDDEGINSNKTSVESLREANENNSNNGGPRWQRGRCGDLFWDVPLGVSV
ncbi:uncharacterized protein si:dkey-27h10.2 isoform X1 [Takifugu flavidus]|uniref:uncharacterized protein si:dkey-27h10.2 isoform X1 n=1 Tax=Takifugu flavidus TaxID=433684 RepID=UPI0025444E53|nr:uncharacterized protein si:dkey-27h10.2 isoform X1 [Takifugu flavidus]